MLLHGAEDRECWGVALLGALALWLAVHPLVGVRHDAVLYLGQALARGDSATFAGDPFLSMSGQDKFTWATTLTAWLHQQLGIGTANASLLLVCQSSTAAILFALARHFVGTHGAVAGVFLYVIGSNTYGPEQTFGFGEPFVTARSLAEPFVLGGLLAALRGSRRLALLSMVAGSLMHPLIALGGWTVMWCERVANDRRWLWLLATIPAAVLFYVLARGLGVLGRIDPVWLDIIERRNTVFLWQMDAVDWSRALLALWILLDLVRRKTQHAKFLRSAITAVVLLVGMSAWTADLMHIELATQLQLWRSLWILQALGTVLLPWHVYQLWRYRGAWKYSQAFAALAMVTALNANAPTSPWLLAWWVLHRALPVPWQGSRWMPWLMWAASAGLLAMATFSSIELLTLRGPRDMPFALHQAWAPWVGTPSIAAAIIAIAVLLWQRQRTIARLLVGIAAVGFALAWDQRGPLMQAIEATKPPESNHPWQARIPPSSPVLWQGQSEAVWTLLRRPVLYDDTQGAAVVFSRALAMHYWASRRHFEVFREAEIQCQLQHLMLRQPGQPSCATTPRDLASLCGHMPMMRFFVTSERWSPAWVDTWRPPGAGPEHPGFHLHDCNRLLNSLNAYEEFHVPVTAALLDE